MLRQECQRLNLELIRVEMEAELLKVAHQSELLQLKPEALSSKELVDLQSLNESLQWQVSMA